MIIGVQTGVSKGILAGINNAASGPTYFTGTLPANVGELSGWTGTSCWTLLHNLDNATSGPFACAAATDGATYALQKLGAGSTAALAAAPQSNFADQGGYTVNANDDFLYGAQSALWKFSATIPTAYLVTFKFAGTPTSGQIFYGGLDGSNGGWYLEAHATSGIRAGVGSGSGYVNTSYVGGTSFYDGEYHTILLVIDDASGKAKVYSEFGNTESTGLTIASVNAFLTVGPQSLGATWGTAVTYLLSARGEHPLLYTNAQLAFDAYEDARLNGTHPAAITSLPTTLAELNSATGQTFTDGWNISSVSSSPALTGASTPVLVPYTGTLAAGGNGTTPTLAAAPQVRPSFTAQAAALMDSDKDSLGVAGGIPDSNFTLLMVAYSPSSFVSGAGWIGRQDIVAGEKGFRLRTSAANTVLNVYNSYATSTSVTMAVDTRSGDAWRTMVIRGASQSAYSHLAIATAGVATVTAADSASTAGAPGTTVVSPGLLGANTYDAIVGSKIAFCAWLPSQVSNANILALINGFRWRYGL